MSLRQAAQAAFLASAGWGRAAVHPLPADASFRRYSRLIDGDRRAILMDAPPPQEDVRPFVHVAQLLRALDYSAPAVLVQDVAAGFLLLEDLGDATYTRLIAAGTDEAPLYGLAVDLLTDLHARFSVRSEHGIAPYDEVPLLAEAALLTDWFLPAATGQTTPDSIRSEYLALWRELLPLARAVPDSLVLRDYHVDNLMLVDGRSGLAACGLLDFQDALIGPVAYDLVSLLEDARRDVADELREAMIDRYLRQQPLDRAALGLSLAVLGAQRHAKVIGIFCRLALRDGKFGYLRHLPRLWRMIARSLAHPALAPMEQWIERFVRPEWRGVPPSLAPSQASAVA